MLDKLWDLVNEYIYCLNGGKNILKSYLILIPRYNKGQLISKAILKFSFEPKNPLSFWSKNKSY